MGDNPEQIVPVKKHNFITRENAAELGRRGWEKKRELAAQGMADAVQEWINKQEHGEKIDVRKVPMEAWKHVIKRATEQYFKSDNIRGMSEMASFIGKNTGMIQEPSKSDQIREENHLLGLDEARIVLQVYNYYNTDFKKPDETVDVIDAELNDLITEELSV